jgi:TIR domain
VTRHQILPSPSGCREKVPLWCSGCPGYDGEGRDVGILLIGALPLDSFGLVSAGLSAAGIRWDVFLAHASTDIAPARRLYGLLDAQGVRVCFDEAVLRPGDDWHALLPRYVRESAIVVALVSPATPDAHYERSEIIVAVNLVRREGRRLVPVLLARDADMPYGTEQLHALRAFDDAGLAVVAEQLAALVRHPERVPPLKRTVGSMRVSIFVSYRRGDARDSVGRITDHLMQHFGDDAIFHDVDSIPVGRDFRQYISSAVEECDVLLAIIGAKWMEKDAEGTLRISLPNDFVRAEIAAALQRDIPVVPVLVRRGKLPTQAQLPPDVQPLIFRQAIVVRSDPDFRSDIQRLISAIERTVTTPGD